MARKPTGRLVGTIKTAHLVSLLGHTVQIRRSKRDDPSYPLYLSTGIGPIHLNHPRAQEMCLEFGDMTEIPDTDPQLPANDPVAVPAVAPVSDDPFNRRVPEKKQEVEPNEPEKRGGFLAALESFIND